MKVGVAGVGRMGAALAKRLLEVGHEVVVWNRNPGKRPGRWLPRGATVAATPK